MIGAIPIEFILFGLTLVGVAVLHRHTLAVALSGLIVITLYKLVFTGFKTGAGLQGLGLHLQGEWVILVNLFCLLLGFAALMLVPGWQPHPPHKAVSPASENSLPSRLAMAMPTLTEQ